MISWCDRSAEVRDFIEWRYSNGGDQLGDRTLAHPLDKNRADFVEIKPFQLSRISQSRKWKVFDNILEQ